MEASPRRARIAGPFVGAYPWISLMDAPGVEEADAGTRFLRKVDMASVRYWSHDFS